MSRQEVYDGKVLLHPSSLLVGHRAHPFRLSALCYWGHLAGWGELLQLGGFGVSLAG